MSTRRAVTASADPARPMPDGLGGRLDRIEAAIASLREEERRASRLGLEVPLSRCREQIRYWEFLRCLFTIDPHARRARPRPGAWE